MRARYTVALLFVTGCRCAELPDLIFACDDAGVCPGASVCVDGFCVPNPDGGGNEDGGFDAGCVPTRTCSSVECGEVGDDGCGGVLDCGPCNAPFICGLDEKNRCGCHPVTSASDVCPNPDAGLTCGSITIDNCGSLETFACGAPTCASGNPCYENHCCSPPSDVELCSSAQFGCGTAQAYDMCGTLRTMHCGGCSGMTPYCVSTEMGSICVPVSCNPESDAEFCDRHGANCGLLTGIDNCGATRPGVSCGGACDAGECSGAVANLCQCQTIFQGCVRPEQCCGADAGTTCGSLGRCCTDLFNACGDDGECCTGFCSAGLCCVGDGHACSAGKECCSGVCGADGGCEAVDAGSTYDGGEL